MSVRRYVAQAGWDREYSLAAVDGAPPFGYGDGVELVVAEDHDRVAAVLHSELSLGDQLVAALGLERTEGGSLPLGKILGLVASLRAELAESKNVKTLGDVFKRIAELHGRAEEHGERLAVLAAERDALRAGLEDAAADLECHGLALAGLSARKVLRGSGGGRG